MKYGYARVSTEDQNAAMQHAALVRQWLARRKTLSQNQGMKTPNRNRRLQTLAADLAELEHRTSEQRIRIVIEEAKRRKLRPGRTDLLKPYQVESALRRIGQGDSVLSAAQSLHCGSAAIYRAIAARG